MTSTLEEKIVSIFGLGKKTKFPGTLGSLVSLFFSIIVSIFFSKTIYEILFAVFLSLGLWMIYLVHKRNEPLDYSWIIIDEWIGMWLANFFLFESSFSLTQKIIFSVLGFVIFRILDIFKFIPPIGAINRESNQTTMYVVLDDIIAGCYSYVILMFIFGFYNLNSIYIYFLILSPAMIANATPVFLRKIKFLEKPIDEKIFGQNKTWRGFMGAIIVGTLFYYLMTKIGLIDSTRNTGYILFIGFLFSFGAITGDLIKSYFKRKMNVSSGESWIPFDQIDYILGAVIATYFIYYYSFSEIIMMLLVGGIMSMLAHRSGYVLKMINTKQ